jgi:hypothetical protein
VRRLTKYGREWLDVMKRSSHSRKHLLRTRSQGCLGIHNWVLYEHQGQAAPPGVDRTWSEKARRKIAFEEGNADFTPFQRLDPEADVQLAPLTDAANVPAPPQGAAAVPRGHPEDGWQGLEPCFLCA